MLPVHHHGPLLGGRPGEVYQVPRGLWEEDPRRAHPPHRGADAQRHRVPPRAVDRPPGHQGRQLLAGPHQPHGQQMPRGPRRLRLRVRVPLGRSAATALRDEDLLAARALGQELHAEGRHVGHGRDALLHRGGRVPLQVRVGGEAQAGEVPPPAGGEVRRPHPAAAPEERGRAAQGHRVLGARLARRAGRRRGERHRLQLVQHGRPRRAEPRGGRAPHGARRAARGRAQEIHDHRHRVHRQRGQRQALFEDELEHGELVGQRAGHPADQSDEPHLPRHRQDCGQDPHVRVEEQGLGAERGPRQRQRRRRRRHGPHAVRRVAEVLQRAGRGADARGARDRHVGLRPGLRQSDRALLGGARERGLAVDDGRGQAQGLGQGR
mmetsp:Transcript_92036/g.281665  ORF Transcript_92036/g.281665 Transcript_92036/m.281665 type:complete len:379 (-) Transcript_92036:1134-2270(-)